MMLSSIFMWHYPHKLIVPLLIHSTNLSASAERKVTVVHWMH